MTEINLDTLLNDKIFYYFNIIGYLPRQSNIFQQLKNNIKINNLPSKINIDNFDNLHINTIIYYYICVRENLVEGTKQLQSLLLNSIKIAADLGDSNACFAISQFYHNITLNIFYDIDETKTYIKLQKELSNTLIYHKNLKQSWQYLQNAIKKNSFKECNKNVQYQFTTTPLNSNETKEKFLNSAANIENIKKNILFTGNPQAEWLASQNKKNSSIKNELIISSSRINYLTENIKFDIGQSNAQWITYNILKKEENWEKYNLPKKNENTLFNVLKASTKLHQLKNIQDFGIYKGNIDALSYYYKIIKRKDPKKYKQEIKIIEKFLKKENLR